MKPRQSPLAANARWRRGPITAACALALSAVLLSGCVHPAAYRDPITRFQEASTVVIEVARAQYDTANKSERDAEIDRRAAQRERITLPDLDRAELRLLGPDDLAARMAGLDALAEHGQLLLTLASAEAPDRARDAANSLDDAIARLLTALGRATSDRFRSSAGGFATLAAEVTGLVLEGEIRGALDRAILASEESVVPLIRLLREEMAELYERRRSMLSGARVTATTAYNQEAEKPTPSDDKLRTAAARIKSAEDAWDGLPLLLSAGPGLEAMAEAHQGLVDYARSSKQPQDLADLIEATDAFVTRAAVIADAIRAIREAKE